VGLKTSVDGDAVRVTVPCELRQNASRSTAELGQGGEKWPGLLWHRECTSMAYSAANGRFGHPEFLMTKFLAAVVLASSLAIAGSAFADDMAPAPAGETKPADTAAPASDTKMDAKGAKMGKKAKKGGKKSKKAAAPATETK
jgi:hypothetical protein